MSTGLHPTANSAMGKRIRRSLVASTSASTLTSIPIIIALSRQQQQARQELASLSYGSSKGKGRVGHIKSDAVVWIISAVTLLQSMPLAHGQQQQTPTLQARSPETSTHSGGVNLSKNLPIQLVIITASLVLFAMFVTAMACLFRSSSSRSGSKSARGSLSEGIARKKNSWSPGGANSIYTYSGESMNNSTDSLSLSKKHSDSRKSGSALSPVSPMPLLKDQEEQEKGTLFYTLPTLSHGQAINMPAPVAMSPRSRGHGWQLYDAPVPHSLDLDHGGDVEAAGLGPTRRPSFIDRLLAHRADPNDARLPNGQLAGDSIVVPRVPSSRKVSGSAILSALNPLRTRDTSQKRLTAVESDFEGSIGGRDGEIPMAKRIRNSQGRFAFDEATIAAASPVAQRHSIDRFSPLPQRFFAANRQSSPRTPGLAGVGATWNTDLTFKNDHGRVATFAELQRMPVSPAEAHRWKMQTTIDQWVQESRFAGMPPPSRRGSSASFLTMGGASQYTMTAPQTEEAGLVRIPSIRPHFAATTTLASWLNEDQRIDEQSEDHDKADSIIEKYLMPGNQASPDAEFDRKRGMLWEQEEENQEVESLAQPPSYHSQTGSSVDGTMGHVHGQNTTQEQQLEEEKRQADRRQRHLLKERRRGERRASRQSQRVLSRQLEDTLEQQQQQQDFILDMDECREQQQQQQHPHQKISPDEIVAQSRRSSTKIILSGRSTSRMTPMSPPESPLTSASEGPSDTPRRRSEHFLVPSSRSRSSINSGSQRSVSHSVVSSQQRRQLFENNGRRLVKKQSHGQINLLSVSERPTAM